jgi:hypothetical protein
MRAKTEYVKSRQGILTEKVKCHGNCGEEITIAIEEGTKPPPMFCTRCKEFGPPSERSPIRHREFSSATATALSKEAVKIVRPDDPDFAAIAAQCTHISRVRPVGMLSAPGDPSVSRFIV